MKQLVLLIFSIFCISQFYAQEHKNYELNEHKKTSYFRISASLAHTFVPEETANGTKNVVLPSFALDVEFWINDYWGIGLHNDLELMTFEVKEDEHIFVEREYPVLITLDLLWKPFNELVVFVGPGIELEPTENFFVFRSGFEYEIPISSNWDLSPLVFYDIRDGAYNTLSIGLGVGYRFNSKKHQNKTSTLLN